MQPENIRVYVRVFIKKIRLLMQPEKQSRWFRNYKKNCKAGLQQTYSISNLLSLNRFEKPGLFVLFNRSEVQYCKHTFGQRFIGSTLVRGKF